MKYLKSYFNLISYTDWSDTKLNDVVDKNRPKAGRAGLEEAVQRGILRPARASDFLRWGRKMAEMKADDKNSY